LVQERICNQDLKKIDFAWVELIGCVSKGNFTLWPRAVACDHEIVSSLQTHPKAITMEK
jgi:hypothetical protein